MMSRIWIIVFMVCLCGEAYPADKPKQPPVLGAPVIPKLKAAKNPIEAILNGSPDLSFRPRFEHVHQDAILRPATALTLRSLLGFQTQSFAYFDAHAQLSNVSAADNSYNSTKNGQKKYSIIADPAYTEFTQAYLGFSGIPSSYLKVGRQLITLDNQRFVGAVNFRQNLQNFDAVSAINQSIDHLTFFAAYLNRIESVLTYAIEAKDLLLNLKYDRLPYLNISTYAYLLDHHGLITTPTESTDTYGLRLTGLVSIKDFIWSYTAEYAHQQSAANNPTSYGAFYTHIGIGAAWKMWSLSLEQEVLSGKEVLPHHGALPGYRSFRTPLATKHLFQGWADMFAFVPLAGIVDRFATLTYSIPMTSFQLTNDVKISGVYHDFHAQSKSLRYGDEWDLDVTKMINKMFSVSVIYADFMSDLPRPTLYPSTQKVWFSVTATFS
ncbi:MAG: alginate export family protein [Legionellales bacterium]|nr:alginate export family protein [Legionellales bacterium]